MNRDVFGKLFGKRRGVGFAVLLVALAVGVVIGTLVQRGAGAEKESGTAQLKISGEGQALGLANAASLQEGFGGVAQAVEAAVVNVNTSQVIRASARTRRGGNEQQPGQQQPFDFFGDDLFDRFFGGSGAEADRKVESLGSGVIVDGAGYILTNHHVVAAADKVTARLASGEELAARVVGTDPETDLAVIKVEAKRPLPYARVGDSDKLRVGDWVIAIGSPFGLEQTVTAGIISATHRNVLSGSFGDYLQTDAAINRGNSGGPLVNLRGEVVGINTFISTTTGGSVGVGFAIPSVAFINSYNQLVSKGKIERGWLGVTMNTTPFSAEMAKFFGVKAHDGANGYGVLVTQLVDENGKASKTAGPAAKAGIQEEDVIVEFGGKPVKTFFDLRSVVANTPPGQTVEVKVVRFGEPKVLKVKLEERMLSARQEDTLSMDKREAKPADKEIGLNIRDLTAAQLGQLDLEEGGGVLIDDVRAGSLADDAGLAAGMVIAKANGKVMKSARQFYDYVNGLRSGDAVVVKVVVPAAQGRPAGLFYTSFVKP